MTPIPAASGIVLAGGRSARFGRDKLAEPIGGRPLLHLAIESLAAVTSEVIVVAAPDATPDLPAGVRLVHDEAPFEGPLAGCMAGLTAAREPLVLIVGGDMPSLDPAVLGTLVRTLHASMADACVVEHLGRRQPLPMALRTGSGTALVARLLAERERRLGAVLDRLIVRTLAEGEWRPLDPEARTLRDVDVPGDLDGS
jgi:molybdopterin-guanine dinucleotide biosynthesis protein A